MAAPIIGRAILGVTKRIVKQAAKKKADTAKKAKPKAKKDPNKELERRVLSESKGHIGTKGKVARLKEQERTGLISAGERQAALNKMTKSSMQNTRKLTEQVRRDVSKKRMTKAEGGKAIKKLNK